MRQALKKPTAARGDAAAAALMKSPEQFKGQYSQDEEKASGAKSFATRKFDWLLQVASDAEIASACGNIAIAIAHFWRNETTGAWPAIGTLASILGCSQNPIRRGIADLERRGHLIVKRSVGGKGSTNTFLPTLKPSRKWKGLDDASEGGNPSILPRLNTSISDAKPSRKWKGNPSDTVDSVRGRASSAPPTEPGKIGDSDSPVAAPNAARSVLPSLDEIITFSDGKWIITSAPVMDHNRNIRTFMAREVNGGGLGTESDFVIYPDGAIEQDIPF